MTPLSECASTTRLNRAIRAERKRADRLAIGGKSIWLRSAIVQGNASRLASWATNLASSALWPFRV
jgi:hypothetical protein